MNDHPIFFFVGILMLGIAILFGVVFSNVFKQISENDQLATTTEEFGIMSLFMKNLPLFVLIIFVSIGIVLWTKFGGGRGGGGGL